MNQQELDLILESHKKWLNDEEGGSRADLRDAILRGAILRDANLCGASGNCREIKTIQTDIWQIVYTKEIMQIGCQRHSIIEWLSFDDDRISSMDERALDWWKKWRPILVLILEVKE